MSLELIAALLVLAVAQARPDSQPPPRDPISTEARTGMALIRGRVTDRQTGRPLPRVMVTLGLHPIDEERALARAARGGQPPIMPRITVPDADGGYEFTEIAAGRYLVMFDPDPSRATHLRQTLGALEPTDENRGLQRVFPLERGRYVVCAEPGPTVWSASSLDGERFARTCAPEAVVVGTADPGIVEIRMRRSRTFSISGIVLNSSGKPAPGAVVSLNRFERNGSYGVNGAVTADGRFIMANILPGDYAITASPGGPVKPGTGYRRPAEHAYYPVRVESSDIDGLVVPMVKGVDVAGRIVLEDSAIPFKLETGWAPPLVNSRLANDPLPGSGSMVSDMMGPTARSCWRACSARGRWRS